MYMTILYEIITTKHIIIMIFIFYYYIYNYTITMLCIICIYFAYILHIQLIKNSIVKFILYMENHVLSELAQRKQHTAQHMYSHTKIRK